MYKVLRFKLILHTTFREHIWLTLIYSFIINQPEPICESINGPYSFFFMDSFLLVYGQFPLALNCFICFLPWLSSVFSSSLSVLCLLVYLFPFQCRMAGPIHNTINSKSKEVSWWLFTTRIVWISWAAGQFFHLL
jgi:hypothetical protein